MQNFRIVRIVSGLASFASYEEVPYEEVPYEEVPYEEAPYEEVPYEEVPYWGSHCQWCIQTVIVTCGCNAVSEQSAQIRQAVSHVNASLDIVAMAKHGGSSFH